MQQNLKAKAKDLVFISKLSDIGFNLKGNKAKGTIILTKKIKNKDVNIMLSTWKHL